MKTDLDVLVEHEIATVNMFGYGSFREENKEQQAEFSKEREEIRKEATTRGLMDDKGVLTAKGAALNHKEDDRVKAKRADNQQYFAARFGRRGSIVSPYGERY